MVKVNKTSSGKSWRIEFDGYVEAYGCFDQGAPTGVVYMPNNEDAAFTADDMVKYGEPTIRAARQLLMATYRGVRRDMEYADAFDVRTKGARVFNAGVIQ